MTVSTQTIRRIVTFGAVGLGATASYIALSTLFTSLGYTPWKVSSIVYLGIIPLAYLGQRNFTFRSRAKHNTSLPRYLLIQVVGLSLAALIPRFLAGYVPPALSFFLVSAVIAIASYILLASWAFRNRSEETK